MLDLPPEAAAPPQASSEGDVYRRDIAQKLISSAESGELSAAFAKLPQEDKVDQAMRQNLKGALLQSASNGQLETALSQVASKDMDQEVRENARQTLLDAAGDGRLEGALVEVVASLPPQVDADAMDSQLKTKARDVLVKACMDDKLNEALAQVEKEGEAQPLGEDAAGNDDSSKAVEDAYGQAAPQNLGIWPLISICCMLADMISEVPSAKSPPTLFFRAGTECSIREVASRRQS
jgi:hypothetical protein